MIININLLKLTQARHLLLTAMFFMLAFTQMAGAQRAKQLSTFKECILIDTPWADGDSFLVRFPDGKEQTVRLYGVDCLEMHVQGDDSNARRLRDQRRYFSIADILDAKAMGETARKAAFELMAEPFTVHTAFVDGRGDSRFSRIYAFVTLSNGQDLAETLVTKGLARAYGITRERHDGIRSNEWRERLKDLELVASRNGVGAWALTDWNKLPAERQEARKEQYEIDMARGIGQIPENSTINLNSADKETLITVPGVGPKLAEEIVRARPFKKIEDLRLVPGVGASIYDKISPFFTIEPKKNN